MPLKHGQVSTYFLIIYIPIMNNSKLEDHHFEKEI